jgi:hypothetical protein
MAHSAFFLFLSPSPSGSGQQVGSLMSYASHGSHTACLILELTLGAHTLWGMMRGSADNLAVVCPAK